MAWAPSSGLPGGAHLSPLSRLRKERKETSPAAPSRSVCAPGRCDGRGKRKEERDGRVIPRYPFLSSNPPPGRRPPLRRAATLSSGLKGGEGGAPAFMERGYYHLPPRAWDDHAREGESVVRFPSIMPHTPMVLVALFWVSPGERKNTLARDRAPRSPSSVKERRRTPFRRVGAGPDRMSGQHPPAPAAPAPHAVPAFLFTPPGRLPFVSPGKRYDAPPPGWPLPRLAPRGPSSPHGWIIEPPLPRSPP